MAEGISRKEAIKRSALLLGVTMSSSLVASLLKGCALEKELEWSPEAFDIRQLQAAADFAEVLLPRTETPGAKDAQVERILDQLVSGYLSGEESEFIKRNLDTMADDQFNSMAFEEQNRYVADMAHSEGETHLFFRRFKQLAMLGFFSSKIGATQLLNYDEIPGIYEGCISLKSAGGKTWAL